MKFDQYNYNIGAHFLGALINADDSGLSDEEIAALNAWEADSHPLSNAGHWTVSEDSTDYGVCDVTGAGSDINRVAYVFPTGD